MTTSPGISNRRKVPVYQWSIDSTHLVIEVENKLIRYNGNDSKDKTILLDFGFEEGISKPLYLFEDNGNLLLFYPGKFFTSKLYGEGNITITYENCTSEIMPFYYDSDFYIPSCKTDTKIKSIILFGEGDLTKKDPTKSTLTFIINNNTIIGYKYNDEEIYEYSIIPNA